MPRVAPFVLLLSLAGCGSTVGARWDGIQGADWILQSMEGAPLLAGTEVSLTFDVGRLYGRAVNRYTAQYERTEEVLKIDTPAATKKFRDEPPGATAQEARYFELLAQIDGWDLGGGRLELKREDVTILSFKLRESKSRS